MNIGHSSDLPIVALIAGPTASGKSALAMTLAERHDGTVVNADSAQVYRDLRVLTARPSPAEEARVPHALFGHVDGAQAYSAAAWAADAKAAIAQAHEAGRLPILAGGTGMYLRTLIDGIAPVPDIDPDIRAAVRAMPVAESHADLERLDPAGAARLRPSDTSRVARALEVVRSTGRPLADWQAQKHGGIGDAVRLCPMILLPDRDWLMARCDRRFTAMLEQGAVKEAVALADRRDIPATAPVRRAIGVRELSAWQAGEIDREEAIADAQVATRRYAKRQYTWFRNQPPTHWPRTDETQTDILSRDFETKYLG